MWLLKRVCVDVTPLSIPSWTHHCVFCASCWEGSSEASRAALSSRSQAASEVALPPERFTADAAEKLIPELLLVFQALEWRGGSKEERTNQVRAEKVKYDVAAASVAVGDSLTNSPANQTPDAKVASWGDSHRKGGGRVSASRCDVSPSSTFSWWKLRGSAGRRGWVLTEK